MVGIQLRNAVGFFKIDRCEIFNLRVQAGSADQVCAKYQDGNLHQLRTHAQNTFLTFSHHLRNPDSFVVYTSSTASSPSIVMSHIIWISICLRVCSVTVYSCEVNPINLKTITSPFFTFCGNSKRPSASAAVSIADPFKLMLTPGIGSL